MRLIDTTTPLGANASVTSTPATLAGIVGVRNVFGSVLANKAGTLAFEFSDDGETWVTPANLKIAVAATTWVGFTQAIYAGHVRIVYTNGATAQTSFHLAAYYVAGGDDSDAP